MWQLCGRSLIFSIFFNSHMADGRKKNGGARSGAGRKPKEANENLRELLSLCAPQEERESILRGLVEDAQHVSFRIRNEARKLLLAYMFGTPVARQELSGSVDVNMLTLDEVKKRAAERRKQVESLDD
jgi:hypothetical protein